VKTVPERCQDLGVQLTRLREVKRDRDRAAALDTRREELESKRDALTDGAAIWNALIAHGHVSPDALPSTDDARESCEAALSRLHADPDTLTRGRDYKTLLRRLDTVVDQLNASTSRAWRTLAEQHMGGDDEQFLQQVERVPGQARIVADIRSARTALREASQSPPRSDAEYQLFLKCSAALRAALAKLDPEGFPPAVLRFFKQAQSPGGAPLALLTDEVRGWLTANSLLEQLRVRFDASVR